MNAPQTSTTTEDIEQTLGIDKKGRKTGLTRKLVYTVATILFLIAVWWGWNQLAGSVVPNYVTEQVSRGDLTLIVSATGDLQAVNTVEVGSEISGLIKSVLVDYNDRVSAGQLLAKLDIDRLEAEVAQGEAALRAAEATLTQALASLKEQKSKTARTEQLAKQDLISDQEIETARAALTRAEANVSSARSQVVVNRASLNMAQTTLSKASIRSPIDGVVLTSNIKSGQAVAASFQTPVLFTLAEDLTRMELHVDVDEADIGGVRDGQEASFTVDAYPDTAFPATITKVHFAPQTVSGVVTYEAILEVDNTSLLLRPGMTATTEIITDRVQGALLVPNSALRFTPPNKRDEQYEEEVVWTMKNDVPAAVPVKTGMTDNRLTQVLEGDLVPGQELLVNIKREE